MSSHFNRCVFVDLPQPDADGPFHVFEFDDDPCPNGGETAFREALANIAEQLRHNDHSVALSVEIVILPPELSRPGQEDPFAAAMRRMELIRDRLADLGVAPDRVRMSTL